MLRKDIKNVSRKMDDKTQKLIKTDPEKFSISRVSLRMSGVLDEGVSFSALLPLKWSSPAKGNRPILPHEQIIFNDSRRTAVAIRKNFCLP